MGMNRKYRESGKPYKTRQTGSIAKWMGLSDEGIRLYERHRLIHPEKDEQNRYREFDIMDITMLLYGMVYRESGFSMKEAGVLANEASLDQVHEAYCQKIVERRAELNMELLRLERVEEMSREMDLVRGQYGVCSVEMSPAMYRLEFMDRSCMTGGAKKQEQVNRWMKEYLPFAMLSTRYRQDSLYNERDKVEAVTGLGIYAGYAEALGVREDEHVAYHPPVRAVHTILSGNNDMLNPDYSGALRYVQEHGLRVCGDPIGFGIANLHFSDSFDRYYHIWIPVEDAQKAD